MLSTAFLLAVSMVMGQAGGTERHLKGLQWFVGEWRAEVQLQEDIPQIAKKGDQMEVLGSHRWILGRNAIQVNWTHRINGEEVSAGRALIGWEGLSNKIMQWSVTKEGNSFGEWTQHGDRWSYAAKGVEGGVELSGNLEYWDLKPNSFRSQVKNWKVGDQILNSPVFLFERVDSPKRDGLPKKKIENR